MTTRRDDLHQTTEGEGDRAWTDFLDSLPGKDREALLTDVWNRAQERCRSSLSSTFMGALREVIDEVCEDRGL